MRMRKKADFPQKVCPVCGLTFSWRKKWALVWDQVKYCSERCRRHKTAAGHTVGSQALINVERD